MRRDRQRSGDEDPAADPPGDRDSSGPVPDVGGDGPDAVPADRVDDAGTDLDVGDVDRAEVDADPDAVDGDPRSAPVRDVLRRVRDANSSDAGLEAVAKLREALPGDPRLGDPLSTAPTVGHQTLPRRVARLAGQRAGVVHQLGLASLQVWQAAAEAQGRGRGTIDVAVLFTDLVGFSSWALDAGDSATLLLLRRVADAQSPAVSRHRGRVVKWLGDGMMATFREPADAVRAVEASRERLAQIEVAGYVPQIRSGVHVGRPRFVGGDVLGLDVNIAARVADAAGPDELLASSSAIAGLDEDAFAARRRPGFAAKGVPAGFEVFSVRSRE